MSEKNKSGSERLKYADRVVLYLGLITLATTSVFSTCAIYQNTQSIETAKAAFQTSIEPTIDVNLPEEYGREISIQNTSSVDINNIRILPICYYIKKVNETFEILNRHPLESVKLPVESLKPSQKSQIALKAASCSQLPKTGSDYVNSLVVVFHRQTDNKRFVKIEPFVMTAVNPNPDWASSFFSEGHNGWSGDPSMFMNLTKKIKETEAVFFRIDK